MRLRELLVKHEGLRLEPYRDTVGKLTIGVGRNLDDVGISNEEAMLLLDNDIEKATNGLLEKLPWVANLDSVRRDVLVDMAFNLGVSGLLEFKNTLKYVKEGNYDDAALNMLKSKWSVQVGKRSHELAEMMRTGQYA